MGLKDKLKHNIAKAQQKGLSAVIDDAGKSIVDGARHLRQGIDNRGGLVKTLQDGYEAVAGSVKKGVDLVFTDGSYDAEKGQAIYERARNRAINAGQDVMDFATTHSRRALERLRDGIELEKQDYQALFVSQEELASTYKGVGTIKTDGVELRSRMIRPEFDAVIEFAETAREHLPKGRPYVAQIRDDIRAGAVTSADALIDMYQHHPDFKDEPATVKKAGLVLDYLRTLDDTLI